MDLDSIIADVCDTLVTGLGKDLLALFLFGSTARGENVPGHSDVDLLLLVAPGMPLVAARDALRPVWHRCGDTLQSGPLVATPEDLALHLSLFPSFHRHLRDEAVLLHGDGTLDRLPSPPPLDPVEEVAYVAARAITDAATLAPATLSPRTVERRTRLLHKLARRFTGVALPARFTPLEALATVHSRLRELAGEMPEFAWHGAPPGGDLPSLLPGCLAFYRRERTLLAVLERVDREILARVDWDEVGAATADEHAQFGLATPWQLRLAASRWWTASLFFQGFELVWGADILQNLETDEATLLKRLARICSEQRVEKVPAAYLSIENTAVSTLIHDTQNVLLNAGLRAELFARLTGREFDLPDWTPPGREVPVPKRVGATWERWQELTMYYARLWRRALL